MDTIVATPNSPIYDFKKRIKETHSDSIYHIGKNYHFKWEVKEGTKQRTSFSKNG